MIIKVFTSIFRSPKTGWEALEDPKIALKSTGHKLIVLIAAIIGALSFIGILIHFHGDVRLATRYFGFNAIKWGLSLYIASWAISKLSKGFKGDLAINQAMIAIPICSSFLIMLIGLSYILTSAKAVLYTLSTIGVVYLYFAIQRLSGITKERIPGFLLISLLVFALIVFIMEMILVIIFNIPVHL